MDINLEIHEEIDDITCPKCVMKYNLTRNLPSKMPCGHDMCLGCLRFSLSFSVNIQCPTCLQIHPPNLAEYIPDEDKIDMIISVSGFPKCPTHENEVVALCLTDKTPLCEECFSTHNTFSHAKISFAQALNKMKAIKALNSELEKTHKTFFKEVESQLGQKKMEFLCLMDKKFVECMEVLRTRFMMMKLEIENQFTNIMEVTKNKLYKICSSYGNLQKLKDMDIFELLDCDLINIDVKELQKNLDKYLAELNTKFKSPNLFEDVNFLIVDDGILESINSIHFRCYLYKDSFINSIKEDLTGKDLFQGPDIQSGDKVKYIKGFLSTGRMLAAVGKYDLASQYYKKAQELGIDTYENELETAYCFMLIGDLHHKRAQYNQAAEYFQKALQIRKKYYPDDHPKVGNIYDVLGKVMQVQGKYSDALAYCQKSFVAMKKHFGENHPETAQIYNDFGKIYHDLGKNYEALEHHKKSYEIRKLCLGENHPDVAQSCNDIGNVYHHIGRYNDALEYHVKALAIRRQHYGDNHPETAHCYNNIGNVYYRLLRIEDSLNYHNKALEIRKSYFGENHPDVASSYTNIGAIYYDQKNYDRSLKYSRKALMIKLKVFGEKHLGVARSFNNIGETFNVQLMVNTAQNHFRKANMISKAVLNQNNVAYLNKSFALEISKLTHGIENFDV